MLVGMMRRGGVVILLMVVCSSCLSAVAMKGGGGSSRHMVEVQVSSLQKTTTCGSSSPSGSPRKRRGAVSLRVVHKHGACSKVKSESRVSELDVDQERVDSINAKLSSRSPAAKKVEVERKGASASLPSKSGLSIGSGNYIVSVGLGTPTKDLPLVFDTGSDLTWTQCEPCVKSCYTQVDPTFNPGGSTSYSNVSCASPVCAVDLLAATGVRPSCSSTRGCIYGIQYGDSSFSAGYLAKDRLSLTPADALDAFLFGCGQNNQGLFGGSAGLLGLGRNKLSAVSQAAPKYGHYFSYCLPRDSSSTGHLTFGRPPTGVKELSSTPLLPGPNGTSFYFVDLQSISVGGRRLPISPTVFSAAGSLIDSGTVITRLPPQAYSALSSAFKHYMSTYPPAPPLSILDTCFDLAKYPTVSIPKITLSFRRRATLDLPLSGILYASNASQVCLAFAGNTRPTAPTILGNVQQQTFDVVYDIDGKEISFGPNGC